MTEHATAEEVRGMGFKTTKRKSRARVEKTCGCGVTFVADLTRVYCDGCRVKRKMTSGIEAKARWVAKNPDRRRHYQRSAALRRRYDLTEEQFQALLVEQGGLCAIIGCGRPANRIDHCHLTGRTRGILCHRCNIRLSALEDEEWAKNAMAYLDHYKEGR